MIPAGLHEPVVVCAVAYLVGVTCLDIVSGHERVPLGLLVLPVLVTAITVSVVRTATLAALASAAGLAIVATGSTAPDSMVAARVALLVLGSAACILGASRGALARSRSRETEAHEQRYRAILETADEGVAVFGRDGALVWANARLGEVLGVAPGDLIGRRVDEVVTEALPPGRTRRGADDRGREQGTVRREVPHRHPDGRIVDLLVSGRPLSDDGGTAGMVRFYTDVTDRRRTERELQRLSLFDPVTGLANRALFLDRLEHELARRSRTGLAVLVLDLDRFRAVNDSVGHRSGDQLLTQVGRRLLQTVRPFDTVARLGGDEFALLCPVVDDADAEAVARRLLDALLEPVTVAGLEMSASASIGIALALAPSSDTGGMVDRSGSGEAVLGTGHGDRQLREAEAAMHAAKQRGRACFEVYQPSMGEQASDQLRVLSELRGALARDELLLHYQPIFALDTGAMHGVECLVRWQHPERGLLLPCDFLPAAEESGLILELGLWVLRAATRQAARWQETGNATNISVNLSVRQLLHPTLVEDVRAALADAGLAPGRLTLEVTESALITDLAAASVVLDELHGLGIRLSLDDFGTGYCSLTYLRHLAVDELKLDRSFLVDLDDSTSHAVIRAAIDMARALGMSVVGEGVERPEQLAALQQLGCGLGQGFLLGRPEAADDLSLLRSAVAALNNAGDRLVRLRPHIPTRRGTIARQT
ncbi:MAG: hypothetical protein QOJ32_2938 [Frankiaceae bacterium]|nr:hypothetical protein [Frankiaceae bacterium]